jgi:hypothetical protein
MSDQTFERAVMDWLDAGSDHTSPAAIDAVLLAVKTTPQERDLRVPRRIISMPFPIKLGAGIAGAALAVVLAISVMRPAPNVGPPSGASSVAPSTDPSPTNAPTDVAPGITGWAQYTSATYGFGVSYPDDWSVFKPAARKWHSGDQFPGDGEVPFADSFTIGEGDDAIGLLVWEHPAKNADFETEEGLKSWVQSFCEKALQESIDSGNLAVPACDAFPLAGETMCLDASGFGRTCGPALLVSTADAQYAFFTGSQGWTYIGLGREVARVVVVAREDSFPPAARYGGSVALLKSILAQMGVTPCITDLLCDF